MSDLFSSKYDHLFIAILSISVIFSSKFSIFHHVSPYKITGRTQLERTSNIYLVELLHSLEAMYIIYVWFLFFHLDFCSHDNLLFD